MINLQRHTYCSDKMEWGTDYTLSQYPFFLPFVFFLIAHEVGRYWHTAILPNIAVSNTLTRAGLYLQDWLTSNNTLDDSASSEAKRRLTSLLQDPHLNDTWRRAIAADNWAFYACVDRFSPSQSCPRLSIPPLVEVAHSSGRETTMYTFFAAEMVFAFTLLEEFYRRVIQNNPIPEHVRLPAVVRQELFLYIRAQENSQSLSDFVLTNYGAGLLVRIVMSRILEDYTSSLHGSGASRSGAVQKDHHERLVFSFHLDDRILQPACDFLFAPITKQLGAVRFMSPLNLYRHEGMETDAEMHIVLSPDPVPGAFSRVDGSNMVRINLGLVLSVCLVTQVIWMLNQLLFRKRMSQGSPDEYTLAQIIRRKFQPVGQVVAEVDKLMVSWYHAAKSNWRNFPSEDWIFEKKPWHLASSFLYEQLMWLVLGHEWGHLHECL